MSHHLDSPLAKKDPRLNISDVYIFKGTSGTVLVMDVNPLSGPNGYHPEAMYEFKVDTNEDAVEDMTFRVTFGERQNEKQSVTVRKLEGGEATDRLAEGSIIAQGTTDSVIEGENGIRVFTGSAGEPFYIEGRVVTAVKMAIDKGSSELDEGDFTPETATNLFGNSNVSTIVLEIPNDMLGEKIGFWGTVALATDSGGWRQVQRAANPLIDTLFDFTEIHLDNDEHADYNATNPTEDEEKYGSFVKEKTSAVVKAMGTADDPEEYAEKLCTIIFPDILHYEVGTDAGYTVERRNGRGLTENTPEVMFQLVLNKPAPMGLDASSASGELRTEFPYLSLPVPVKQQETGAY